MYAKPNPEWNSYRGVLVNIPPNWNNKQGETIGSHSYDKTCLCDSCVNRESSLTMMIRKE